MPARKTTKSSPRGLSPDTPESSEPAALVLRRFRQVFNAVKTHFRQVERSTGLGGAQLWALSLIAASEDLGVGGLAQSMDIHQSTASNLVKALVERELVVASKGSADRRSVQLRVLPAGKRVLRQAPGPFSGVLPSALAQLDERTLSRLEKDLGRLIEVLDGDIGDAASVPLGQD